MSRSKKIFALFAVFFILLLAWASYDISSRTTFPGSRPQLRERLLKQQDDYPGDTIPRDSLAPEFLPNGKK